MYSTCQRVCSAYTCVKCMYNAHVKFVHVHFSMPVMHYSIIYMCTIIIVIYMYYINYSVGIGIGMYRDFGH